MVLLDEGLGTVLYEAPLAVRMLGAGVEVEVYDDEDEVEVEQEPGADELVWFCEDNDEEGGARMYANDRYAAANDDDGAPAFMFIFLALTLTCIPSMSMSMLRSSSSDTPSGRSARGIVSHMTLMSRGRAGVVVFQKE